MSFSFLSQFLKRLHGQTGASPQQPHLVLYTRRGCHLCDLCWDQLEKARQVYNFTLEAVDVDTDADLKANFGDQVPVVVIDDKVRFRGRINEVLLIRLLRTKAARRR